MLTVHMQSYGGAKGEKGDAGGPGRPGGKGPDGDAGRGYPGKKAFTVRNPS